MKRIVLTFGLLAGAILSAMMFITLPFQEKIGFDKGAIIGYTTMVAAFLMIFFGVRAYRDNVIGGSIAFGRAFGVGLMIMLIASACYVASWEFINYKLAPDFAKRYAEHVIEDARASGASQAELDRQVKKMEDFQRMYANPLVNVAFTFLEPLPVGLVLTLVSAGILSRRRRESLAHGAQAPSMS
ncbi:MAG: DUF4199 domain-containing protein [Gemmatimonadaceae bacterium]